MSTAALFLFTKLVKMGNQSAKPETKVDVTVDVGDCMAIMLAVFILALLLFNRYCKERSCRPDMDIRNQVIKGLEAIETKPVTTV